MDSADPAPAPPPRRRFPSWRRWAPRAAFESLLIVFSVVLAMAVSQWVEDRRTASRVQEMRGFLRAEIQANRDLLADPEHLPHHIRLKDVFGEALGDFDSPVSREVGIGAAKTLFATGLHPAPVQSAVWSSVSGGDLMEHMDPQEMFALSALYRSQANLEGMNAAGYDAAIGLVDMMAGEEPKPRLMRTLVMLEDVVAQERRLIQLYDRMLVDLDDAPRTASRASGDGVPAIR